MFCAGLAFAILTAGCGRQNYLEKGNKLLENHEYEAAALYFRKAIQKDPNSGEAYYRLGLAELSRNHGLEAYAPLMAAVQLMPSNEAPKVKLADLSLALLVVDPHHPAIRQRQVETLADQLLKNNPNSFDGLRLKASLRLLDRQPMEAISLYEKANQTQPMRPELVQGWVQALFQAGRVTDGERLAFQVIAANKTFGAMYDVLYHQYVHTGRTADAEKVLRAKVSNNPKDLATLLQMARHYASVPNADAMCRVLDQILRDPLDFPEGRLSVGNFYASIGQLDQAVENFNQGARLNPKEKLVYEKRMVDVLLLQGKADETARMVELVLHDEPKDETARRVRAILQLNAGGPENVAAALVDLKELAANSNDARLRALMGHAYLAQGDTDAAQREFQRAIERDDADINSRLALASISLKRKNPQQAQQYIRDVLLRDPGNVRAKLLRAAVLTSAGNYEQARTDLNALLHDNPKSFDVQLQLGLLALAEKKYAEAESIFSRIQQARAGDAASAAALTAAYFAQNESERALEMLSQDLKKSPDSVPLHRLMALAAVRSRKYDVAVAEYQKLLAGDSGSADLRIHLAEVYRLKGDLAQATAVLSPAVTSAPKDLKAAMLLASMYVETGRYPEAQTAFERLLQLKPNNPFVLNNIAFVIAESGGNLNQAWQFAQRALENSPDNPALLDTLGWIYLKKGDKDSALQTFSVVVRKEPRNPVYRYHYAVALFEKGDRERARAEVQNALAARPLPDTEQKIKALAGRIG